MQVIIVLIIVSLSSVTVAGTIAEDRLSTNAVTHDPLPVNPPSGGFELVSEFLSGKNYSDYGWSLIKGNSIPSIGGSPGFYGEPSLSVTNGTTLFSNKNITTGDQTISFQFAVNATEGDGSFVITNSSGGSIAWISVSGGRISVNAISSNSSVRQRFLWDPL